MSLTVSCTRPKRLFVSIKDEESINTLKRVHIHVVAICTLLVWNMCKVGGCSLVESGIIPFIGIGIEQLKVLR